MVWKLALEAEKTWCRLMGFKLDRGARIRRRRRADGGSCLGKRDQGMTALATYLSRCPLSTTLDNILVALSQWRLCRSPKPQRGAKEDGLLRGPSATVTVPTAEQEGKCNGCQMEFSFQDVRG